MPEPGGTSTQAGIFHQNTVAALALADLLDFDLKLPDERVVEVRLEAPEDVDDIVVRYADSHRDYQNVKLGLKIGDNAWPGIWRSLKEQMSSPDFLESDQLTIVVADRSDDSRAVGELCTRVAQAVDLAELSGRLTSRQSSALASISKILETPARAFELLRRTRLLHLSEEDVEDALSRKRLAGATSPAPTLLPVLRDIAGGESRRRGLFQPAPLRRRLKRDHNIVLPEPPEWGLQAYRNLVKSLARIEIPGLSVSGSSEDLFIWPRARDLDRSRPSDFEDEHPADLEPPEVDPALDLRTFPVEGLEKLIVVAGPGYGKSALLTAMGGILADGPYVPVSISLAALSKADSSIIAFLTQHVSQELDLAADWQKLAEQGLLVPLLDGLDEVPSGARPNLVRRIATFSARYPLAPWILSVRDPAIVSGLHDARVIELLPLEDEDIARFADAMKDFVDGLEGWEVARKINLYPDLRRLVRIPLFLAMLLGTRGINGGGPTNRSDLIETYLKTLFHPGSHKAQEDVEDRSAQLRPIAEKLAFELLEKQEIGASGREIGDIIDRLAATRAEARQLMEDLTRNGILRRQSAIRLTFPYPIVQEYLAACHLVAEFADTLPARIDDAIQRPWAQVIQFALELHAAPEPTIRAMLGRPDDAFATGLRLVGRCIANGSKISQSLKDDISDRLVAFWVHAPTNARERVGRLLADGFIDPPTPSLRDALHYGWLINSGGGDIVSLLKDRLLTLSVLDSLMNEERSGIMIYRCLEPALNAAGDAAFQAIAARLASDELSAEEKNDLASLFLNFEPGHISRGLVLSLARSQDIPVKARLSAYRIAGSPLEDDALDLAYEAMRQTDWDASHRVPDLLALHPEPAGLLSDIFRDETISLEQKMDLAGSSARIINDPETRRKFALSSLADPALDRKIRTALQLFEARFGDRGAFEQLIEDIPVNAVDEVGTTLALFGHHRDRELGERAAVLVHGKVKTPEDAARLSQSVTTGMLYVFEMDWLSTGLLKDAPPHPAIPLWTETLEAWACLPDMPALECLAILDAAAQLGSEWARARLQSALNLIEDMDSPEYSETDELGHTLSSTLHHLRKRMPVLPEGLMEKILASKRYNIASQGLQILKAAGDKTALHRLVRFHAEAEDWGLKDTAANAIEQLAARLNILVDKTEDGYRLQV